MENDGIIQEKLNMEIIRNTSNIMFILVTLTYKWMAQV
jgi:hypothetical protein